SWQIEGKVVLPGIDLDDYTGYQGEEPTALCVGNMFVERDHMLGYSLQKQILEGMPHHILGANP
ncbi:MAG TPA: hypothetical protein DIU35_04790, partial [Candidatus Latescibacteria bacterium]|nr:hypothetical protein [Candidatus Latescibacterota bacterium]